MCNPVEEKEKRKLGAYYVKFANIASALGVVPWGLSRCPCRRGPFVVGLPSLVNKVRKGFEPGAWGQRSSGSSDGAPHRQEEWYRRSWHTSPAPPQAGCIAPNPSNRPRHGG